MDRAALPRGNPLEATWVGNLSFDVYVIFPMCAFTGFCNRWKGWNCGALG